MFKEDKKDFLTKGEVSYILSQIKSNYIHKIWFMLAYSLGLNLKELADIKIKDILEYERKLVVNSAQRLRDRILPIPNLLYIELVRLKQNKDPEQFLFQRNGKQIHTRTIQKAFEKISRLSGIKINFYILRRTIAMHLIQKGWDARSVVAFLGHSDNRSTKRLLGVEIFPYLYYSPLDEIYENFLKKRKNEFIEH